MTLEEAIQHLRESLADPTHEWGCEECKQEHEQLLEWLEDYKRLQSVNSWIPCSERMPENADDPGAFCPKYYVNTRYGVTEGWYNPDFDVWFVLIWYYTRRFLDHEISLERGDVPKVCAMMKSDVTHWMPLPAPPETEGKA